jgi:ATP-dependent helicase HrpB
MDKSVLNFPIYEILDQIKETLKVNRFVIVQAEPGAGKSTILPLELIDEPWLENKKIIILEPRRLAARSIAWRMAQLTKTNPGDLIGYRIRHQQNIKSTTKIEIVTEGILLRLLQSNPGLIDYGLVIFDEFHERSLNTDLSIAFTRQVMEILRPDLKILIMSATINSKVLSYKFEKAPVIKSKGRNYPIEIIYRTPKPGLKLAEEMESAIRWTLANYKGNILVFLPGIGEIHKTYTLLKEKLPKVKIFELYGNLSGEQQQNIIMENSPGERRVILSTSIAQTSITINGINNVIDSGLSRREKFDISIGMNRLITERSSKEDVDQRAGRAGRTGPGKAIRLWSTFDNQHLKPHIVPEILETDITRGVLEAINWGVDNIYELQWITPPPVNSVEYALNLLAEFDAVKNNRITSYGKKMLSIPAHPRLAHMLLKSIEINSLQTAIILTSILEEKDFLTNSGADIYHRMNAILNNVYGLEVKRNILNNIRKHIDSWCKYFALKFTEFHIDQQNTGKLLSWAFPERIAMNQGNGHFRLANGKVALLGPNDPLSSEKFLVAVVVTFDKQIGKIRLATSIDLNDLEDNIEIEEKLYWNYANDSLVSSEVAKIGKLSISQRNVKPGLKSELIDILSHVIQKKGLDIINWTEDARDLQTRILCLREWGENKFPDLKDEAILVRSEQWLIDYALEISKLDDFKKIPAVELIRSQLNWDHISELDKLVPNYYIVPSGSNIKIKYFANGELPVLTVRLQELFGLTESPSIFYGRKKLILHLLSPGYKPVQITSDLNSFWKNTYPQIRKELMRKYPRHSWPEDPIHAQAMKGPTKKRNGL